MSDDLVKRLELPWPADDSGAEVTLPIWVLELLAEAKDRIEALTAAAQQDCEEAMLAIIEINGLKAEISALQTAVVEAQQEVARLTAELDAKNHHAVSRSERAATVLRSIVEERE